jgi:hypothetical protein
MLNVTLKVLCSLRAAAEEWMGHLDLRSVVQSSCIAVNHRVQRVRTWRPRRQGALP